MCTIFKSVIAGAFFLAFGWGAGATTINIISLKDATIFNEFDYANGTGPLYIGTTPNVTTRRALLQFDIAGSIPSGATVTSATLTLTLTKIGPAGANGAVNFDLLPLNSSWGEGPTGGLGSGGLAVTGDSTWNYRFYNSTPWGGAGGDFGAVSATTSIGVNNGTPYSFASAPGLVSDVQGWLDTPSSNNGWIIKAANETGVSAREFGSREGGSKPVLSVVYTPVPEPTTGLLFAAAVYVVSTYRPRKNPNI